MMSTQITLQKDWVSSLVRFEPYSQETFKQLLKERSLTLEELSERSGIHIQTLKLWSSGKTRPNLDGLEKLGEFFGVFLYGNWSKKS
jgi:transcriptional regulator with XRE-family HTH domain